MKILRVWSVCLWGKNWVRLEMQQIFNGMIIRLESCGNDEKFIFLQLGYLQGGQVLVCKKTHPSMPDGPDAPHRHPERPPSRYHMRATKPRR
ncbi:MAG: hypothetical protein LBC18_11110, partial [Opitutaceae bacterium]|nr:hypothetical protein [Opitutaceae bacterium]